MQNSNKHPPIEWTADDGRVYRVGKLGGVSRQSSSGKWVSGAKIPPELKEWVDKWRGEKKERAEVRMEAKRVANLKKESDLRLKAERVEAKRVAKLRKKEEASRLKTERAEAKRVATLKKKEAASRLKTERAEAKRVATLKKKEAASRLKAERVEAKREAKLRKKEAASRLKAERAEAKREAKLKKKEAAMHIKEDRVIDARRKAADRKRMRELAQDERERLKGRTVVERLAARQLKTRQARNAKREKKVKTKAKLWKSMKLPDDHFIVNKYEEWRVQKNGQLVFQKEGRWVVSSLNERRTAMWNKFPTRLMGLLEKSILFEYADFLHRNVKRGKRQHKVFIKCADLFHRNVKRGKGQKKVSVKRSSKKSRARKACIKKMHRVKLAPPKLESYAVRTAAPSRGLDKHKEAVKLKQIAFIRENALDVESLETDEESRVRTPLEEFDFEDIKAIYTDLRRMYDSAEWDMKYQGLGDGLGLVAPSAQRVEPQVSGDEVIHIVSQRRKPKPKPANGGEDDVHIVAQRRKPKP